MTTSRISPGLKRSTAALFAFVMGFVGMPAMLLAETVGVFVDAKVAQLDFAAGDVKKALESKGNAVEMRALAQLDAAYPNKKVVIALSGDAKVTARLTAEGGTAPKGLGGEAYAIRTTTKGQQSYWVLGSDLNGTMYGAFQIAETVAMGGFGSTLESQEAPTVRKRGIKLNLPFDERSPTYHGENKGTSYQKAIPDVWDLTFWKTWLDEMARHRYNVLSVWNDHPFTSMIKLPEYPDVALKDVIGYDGFKKAMTIDEKIAFWRQVMAYAHARGFEFLLVNWNIFTDGATGKYGIDNNFANPATVTYMRKCMTKLLETYPDLDGFGVTAGENIKKATNEQKEEWLWNTYGQGMYDYASVNPKRKLMFLHRFHQTALSEVKKYFKSLIALPNVTFDMSFKYSAAHMYSTPVPTFMGKKDIDGLIENKLKTWFTVRNDDLYYLHWGDPAFVRAFVNGMPGKDSYVRGYYIGSDGSAPTRTFFSRNSVTQGGLEVQRHWYMYMLWGRLSYNPATPDAVFKGHMQRRYPGVSSDALFTAWSKASSSIPKITELVQGTLKLDFHWWPEACLSHKGFITAEAFSNAKVGPGSSLCSIAESAANTCGNKKTSLQLADEIQSEALSALAIVGEMQAPRNTELAVNLDNIRAMAHFSLYFANKIRGATFLKAAQPGGAKATGAQPALGKAYCNWMSYVDLMDAMYTGQSMQRVDHLPTWHSMDAEALKDFTSNGGTEAPVCDRAEILSATVPTDAKAGKDGKAGKEGKAGNGKTLVQALSAQQLAFTLPAEGKYSFSIFSSTGQKVGSSAELQGKKGANKVALPGKLVQGAYLVHLESEGASIVKRMQLGKVEKPVGKPVEKAVEKK